MLDRKHAAQAANVLLFLAVWVLAGCNGAPAADQAATQATVAALATENARLAEQVVALGATPAAAVPAPQVEAPAEGAAPAAPPEAGYLPRVLAQVRLAQGDDILVDARIDQDAQRIYVTDSGPTLHVLDAATFTSIASIATTGSWLTLDPVHRRLYVAPGDSLSAEDQPIQITVFDMDTLEVVGAIEGSRHLTVDVAGNRIFTGNRLLAGDMAGTPGVRAYDGATLQLLGESAQVGIPVYNPRRDDLLVVAYTVYAMDADKLLVTADLAPEILQQELAWCNGCLAAFDAAIFAEPNLAALKIEQIATGAGPGVMLEPRFLDATTLQPIAASIPAPDLQRTCGSDDLLTPPVAGRFYRQELYVRYLVYNNLGVYDGAGEPITWREGLPVHFINGQTSQAYANGTLVVDLATLNPVGEIPPFCVAAYSAEGPAAGGLLAGLNGGELLMLSGWGAAPAVPPTQAAPLPPAPITDIVLSPAFAQDGTVFVVVDDRAIYRSTDGGQNWDHLQGGLPQARFNRLDLAVSPAFDSDRLLLVGGFHSDGEGEGVWRSTDGGDTWQPVWTDLTHLRVYQVAISDAFAEDGTALVYARYARIQPWESGASIHRSSDRGLSWSLVVTATTETELPQPAALMAMAAEPELPLRISAALTDLERSVDGVTWESIGLPRPAGLFFREVLAAPGYPDDPALYVLAENALWRTADGGLSWSAWDDARLAGRDYANGLASMAVSPRLADGSYRVLVATRAGEFWALNPVELPQPAPTTTTATATPLAVSPLALPTATPAAALPTPAFTPPPAEPLAGEPTAGLFRPRGAYESLWRANPALQQALGWALAAEPSSTAAAYQLFEDGLMIWRGDTQQILVIYGDNRWEAFDDTFVEGDPESDPTIDAPRGLRQPVRGFGKVWRENTDVRAALGWALDREEGYTAFVHEFERGQLIGTGLEIIGLAEMPDGERVVVR